MEVVGVALSTGPGLAASGLGEVGRNWSRRMLLEVWRALFNKAELKLRPPYRNLCIVCYKFFLLKIQLLYELSPITCTN